MRLALIEDEVEIDALEIDENDLRCAARSTEDCDELLTAATQWLETTLHMEILNAVIPWR